MHTTSFEQFNFFHNSDFSGNVVIVDKETNREMRIPFEALKTLVAERVRNEKIAKIEQMSDDEILGI